MIEIKNSLNDNSRVWVYQANRAFSPAEQEAVEKDLTNFVASWESHGTPLNAAAEVFYDRFVVFFVDESNQHATGCSIDKSVSLMKALEQKFDVKLMDRMNLAYRNNEGAIESVSMVEFQDKIKSGEIDGSTTVFNNLINSKQAFLTEWEVPAKNSWHKNLLAVSA